MPRDSNSENDELLRSYRESGHVLLRATQPVLRRLALASGVRSEDVADVVQQVYVSLYRDRPNPTNMLSWLVRVVICKSRNWLRSDNRRAAALASYSWSAPRGPQFSAEQLLAIHSLMGVLQPKERRLLRLRLFEGLSAYEAAKRAGYAPSSYGKTMTRIFARLREAASEQQSDACERLSG